MKKILSMALASAMVLSMGTMAFAAKNYAIEMTPGKVAYATELVWDDDKAIIEAGNIAYGDTVYYALRGTTFKVDGTADKASLVYEYDAVKGLKLKPTWSMGGSLVEKVELVKKKITDADALTALAAEPAGETPTMGFDTPTSGARQYAYFVGVSLKDSNSTKKQFVDGEIAMAKSKGTDGSDKLAYDDDFVAVSFDVTFEPQTNDTAVKTKTVFTFDNDDDDYTLSLIEEDIATFNVDARGQGDMVISATNKYDADIASKYDANLEFLKTNGATFNRTGELTIYAEEGSYLYEIKADGTLVESKAKYDDVEEAFVLKTRTIGSYVIADEKLKIATAGDVIEVVEPGTVVEPPVVVNPGTGVAL